MSIVLPSGWGVHPSVSRWANPIYKEKEVKITDVKCHLVKSGRNPQFKASWVFVQVFTDEGIVGIGDATNWPASYTIATAIDFLKDVLIGKDPARIERLWQEMYRALYHISITGTGMAAISGIDIALWDIKGKSLGVPIYELLGGRCWDRLRLYCHGRPAEDDASYVEGCLEFLNDGGYTAIKTHLPSHRRRDGRYHRFSPVSGRHFNLAEEKAAYERLKAVRGAVGDDIEIAIDIGGALTTETAIRLGKRFEDIGLLFYEEPVPPENVDALLKVNQQIRAPICVGERLYTKYGFREVVTKQAADIIMPDVPRTGGITEAKKISALAESYYIQVAPHNPNSPLSTLASAQVMASVPNFLILEFVHTARDAPWRDELLSEPLEVKEGYLELPTGPGIGMELNMEAVTKYAWEG